MEIDNGEYLLLKTDITEMKADIKYLKEDKSVVHSLLDEIKDLQIQSAVMIEQMVGLQKDYRTMNENMKSLEVTFNENIKHVKDSVCDIQNQPVVTYNKAKDRFITTVIGTVTGAIMGAIMAFFMGKTGVN